MNSTKILIYDIETSYTVGAVWGLYEQNVAHVLREPYMISFAWKWYGDKKVNALALPNFKTYKTNRTNDRELILKLWELFNEADVIVAHNGNSFDQKWANARFIANGLPPPSPSKYIDTKLIARNLFKFNSNSLNNLGQYLNLGQKLSTGGIGLWVECIEKDNPKAWKTMIEYNKQDVVLLELVYIALLGWIPNHPNVNVLDDNNKNCPNCGSAKLQKRGIGFNSVTKYQRFVCTDCGKWSKSKPLRTALEVR